VKNQTKTDLHPDVSVIICAHAEGRLIHHTIKSVSRSVDHAASLGIKTEIIITGDCLDDATKKVLVNGISVMQGYNIRLEEVSYKDLGLSRNHGYKLAQGDFVTSIDGDDLMAQNWLTEGVKKLRKSKGNIVLHPEHLLFFGARDLLWPIPSSESHNFSHQGMIEINYFSAMMMTRKSTVEEIPYKKATTSEGFGYEDWLWNCDTLQAGYSHLPIKGTMLGYRVKNKGSLFSTQENAILQPSDYLLQASLIDGLESSPRFINKALETTRKDKLLYHLNKVSSVIFRVLRKLGRLHPRLSMYFSSLQNETQHLLRPIETKSSKIPESVIIEANNLHMIDHRIYVSNELKNSIEVYQPKPTNFTTAYWDIVGRLGVGQDYLFIVPYLKNGGAEKLVASFIESIYESKPNAKISILVTESGDSPYKSKLDQRVNFIEPEEAYFQLNFEEQSRLLANIVMQTMPKRLHLITSRPGYRAVERYGKALSRYTRLFVSIFTIDKTPEGRFTHLFIDNMQEAVDVVEAIFTDNRAIVGRLSKLMGLDEDKFKVLYLPADLTKMQSPRLLSGVDGKPLNVLWAGRMDREKHPEILPMIADSANELRIPAKFYAYGTPAFEDDSLLGQVKLNSNIEYRGAFSGGLQSLDLSIYDIFVLTSEWEGMPNVILEATAAGMVVITPDIGGVGELIDNGETGFLVKSFDDVDGYIAAIKSILSSKKAAGEMVGRAQSILESRHSKTRFTKTLKEETKYLL